MREVLKLDEAMRELARELVNEQSLLVFGRGYNYATALEAALKVSKLSLTLCKSDFVRHYVFVVYEITAACGRFVALSTESRPWIPALGHFSEFQPSVLDLGPNCSNCQS